MNSEYSLEFILEILNQLNREEILLIESKSGNIINNTPCLFFHSINNVKEDIEDIIIPSKCSLKARIIIDLIDKLNLKKIFKIYNESREILYNYRKTLKENFRELCIKDIFNNDDEFLFEGRDYNIQFEKNDKLKIVWGYKNKKPGKDYETHSTWLSFDNHEFELVDKSIGILASGKIKNKNINIQLTEYGENYGDLRYIHQHVIDIVDDENVKDNWTKWIIHLYKPVIISFDYLMNI